MTAMALAAATLLLSSCGKDPGSNATANTKQYLEAWVDAYYPGVPQSGLGCYIIADEEPSSGELVGDADTHPYLYGRYNARDLSGIYNYTDDPELAKQLGTYDKASYYGPGVWYRGDDHLPAGLDDLLGMMRVGGHLTGLVPSWLMTTSRYSKPSDYLKHATSYSHGIYELYVDEIIDDIVQWEIDSLEAYVGRHYPGTDSTMFGFYYVQTQAPVKETGYESGDEVYFNYIGRRLDGQVFDCTVRDTAMRYNISVSGKEYEPVYVTWKESYTDITLGEDDSSVIPGFSYAVSNMRKGEKGIALFYSGLGYADSGSGSRIPAYSPLIFEFECLGYTDEPDTDSEDDEGGE